MKNKDTVLHLHLKKKWFDMIKAGIKLEEYRSIKPKYLAEFCELLTNNAETNKYNEFMLSFYLRRDFTKVIFSLGYPKSDDTERNISFDNPTISIGEGKPEWGAVPGVKYFVITWNQNNLITINSNCYTDAAK